MIQLCSQQTAQNIIEIGKRLIEVKTDLGHGNWENYLKNEVKFSQMTANRFMRIANECSNLTSLIDLEPTKLYALLELPSEEREEFIKDNPVDEMSEGEFPL